MRIHSQAAAWLTASVVATNAVAQTQPSCPGGAGAAFGVVAINCVNCELRRKDGVHTTYTFFAEPVVLETTNASVLVAGDIVEAVNGQPITTSAGSDQFSNPAAGPNEITVRRGRDRRVLSVTANDCGLPRPNWSVPNDSAAKLRAAIADLQARLESVAGQLAGSRGSPPPAAPIIVIDGVVVDVTRPYTEFNNIMAGGFGFAVACNSSCSAATGTEGKTTFTYYKYDSDPPIIGVRRGGPADRAGIKVGDVITKVDGRSVLDPEAGLRLWSVHPKDSIHLTVLRDGKEIGYMITR